VSCWVSWLSDILSSEKVTNTKQTWTIQSFEQYFKPCVTSHWGTLFHMNTEKPKLKGLSEIRFRSMVFLLRMAGVPLQMKKMSTIYAIYMVTVIVCCFSTIIGMFVDVYIHWNDLGRAMTTMRAFFPFTNVMWIFSYCR
jgi:Golgi nucleoside diphosphatase